MFAANGARSGSKRSGHIVNADRGVADVERVSLLAVHHLEDHALHQKIRAGWTTSLRTVAAAAAPTLEIDPSALPVLADAGVVRIFVEGLSSAHGSIAASLNCRGVFRPRIQFGSFDGRFHLMVYWG